MVDLVTGAAGFIGRNLMWMVHGKRYDLRWGQDILDRDQLREAARGSDRIIHLAALSGIQDCQMRPRDAWRVNVEGTQNVCSLGLPVLFASTAGAAKGPSVYAETKRIGERVVLDSGGLVFRLANVYGPGMEHKQSLIANAIRAAQGDDPLVLRGTGEQTRDFVHVRDVCSAMASSDGLSGIYTLGSGVLREVREVIRILRSRGHTLDIINEPLGDAEVVDGSIDHRFPPGWKPTIPLEQGLEELCQS